MRQIGTLPDGDAARTLADYLLTLKIETRLEEQPAGWIVWVCDEDRVPQARAEYAEFTKNPKDARFINAPRAAQELRLREIKEDEDYRQRLTDFRKQMTEVGPQSRIVTALLVVTACVVTLTTNFGHAEDGYLHLLWISTQPGLFLTQVAHGEIWRLITPIFIHLDTTHLLFDCLVTASLAGQIERIQGSLRLLWLVVILAVFSNLLQYYFGHATIAFPLRIVLDLNLKFGGLSGVAYGLFGYIWMKSRFEPGLGFQLTSLTVLIMIGWFVGCVVGLIPHVANGAHAGGLVLGLAIGAAPYLWQNFRRLR